MKLDWTAVGAIAAIAAIAFAAIQWAFLGLRNTIVFSRTEVPGRIPEVLREVGQIARLTAELIEIKNKGFRHLSDVILRIGPTRDIWSYEVKSSTSIDKDGIILTGDDRSVIVQVPFLPRGEAIEIAIFSNDFALRSDRVKGGSNRYKIMRDFDYRLIILRRKLLLNLLMLGTLVGVLALGAANA